jgi:toxin ParE1/3/4
VSYRVLFRAAARDDIKAIYDYISRKVGRRIASGYIDRIQKECMALQDFPERGMVRDDLLPGIRIVGFERRVAIAFVVEGDTVRILRIFYGGQNFPKDWLN